MEGEKKKPKKRGRKPKGGKIIQNGSFLEQENESIIPKNKT